MKHDLVTMWDYLYWQAFLNAPPLGDRLRNTDG